MKIAVIYSSRTGNTQKIAEAIHAIMPVNTLLFPVHEAPDPENFDFLALGFWVSKGAPDPAMQAYMKKIHAQSLGVFGTLGAWPDSDHARRVILKTEELLSGNTLLASFLCMGKVSERVINAMQAKVTTQRSHPMTPERIARREEAKKHPNSVDCANAQACFRAVLNTLHP